MKYATHFAILQGAEVVKVNVTVQCTGDKKQLAKPSVSKSKGVAQPLLTDEETEANYRCLFAFLFACHETA